MSQAQTFYSVLDVVKKKLRIPDDTIDDELEVMQSEVDGYINRKLRKRLGDFNIYNDAIVLPLTETTVPPVTEDLKQIANDLFEAKFRLKTTNDDTLWGIADKELEEHITEEFGWIESVGFRVQPTITIVPTSGAAGATITASGTKYAINEVVKFTVGNTEPDTTPTTVVADSTGAFSGVTFVIPTNTTSPGSVDIVSFSNFVMSSDSSNAFTNNPTVPPVANTRFRVT